MRKVYLRIKNTELLGFGISRHGVVGRIRNEIQNKLVLGATEQGQSIVVKSDFGLTVLIERNGHIFFAGRCTELQRNLFNRISEVQIVQREHAVDNFAPSSFCAVLAACNVEFVLVGFVHFNQGHFSLSAVNIFAEDQCNISVCQWRTFVIGLRKA